MKTAQLDNGILNNYAVEPDTYYAMLPSPEQVRNYMLQGVIATLLVSVLMGISVAVS